MSNIQDILSLLQNRKTSINNCSLKEVALTEVPVTLLTVVISTRYSIMLIVFLVCFCVGKEAIQWGVNVFRVA